MVPEHLSILLNTDHGMDTKTCGVEDAFSPDDLSFGSDSVRSRLTLLHATDTLYMYLYTCTCPS